MTADSNLDNSIVPLRVLASTADRRRLMTTKEVAEKRLEVLTSGNETLINGWWFNYFDTPDAVGCFNNEIKIISNLLTGPLVDTKLGNSVLILTEEQFKQLKGKTFDRNEINTDWLTKRQVKEHPVWQELLRESLDAYVDAVFEQYEKRFGKANLMCVSFANSQDVPTLRSCCLRRLDGRSDLYGFCSVLSSCPCLVGVLDEQIT